MQDLMQQIKQFQDLEMITISVTKRGIKALLYIMPLI